METTAMGRLVTGRLTIRPFVPDDLEAVWQLFDREDPSAGHDDQALRFEARRKWLEWSVLNCEQLALLRQPPYGDRAVLLTATGALIGAVGFVPCLDPFGQLWGEGAALQRSTSEVGLFWQIAPAHRRQGYATEAAAAMLRYAFDELRLERVIATTDFDNAPSVRVMEKLGMAIYRNPFPEPPWLQIVGVSGQVPGRTGSPQSLLEIGTSLAEQGEHDAAVACLRAVIRSAPDDPFLAGTAHLHLGGLLADTGNMDAAIDELRECLRLRPDHPSARLGLGNLLEGKGRAEEARKHWTAILAAHERGDLPDMYQVERAREGLERLR